MVCLKLESPGVVEKGMCPASRGREHTALSGGGPNFRTLLALLPLPTEDQRLRKGGIGCISEEGNTCLKGDLPTENGGSAGRGVGSQAGSGIWMVGSSLAWASSCLTSGVSIYLCVFLPGM